jgi:hypothetical protein
MVSSLTRSAEGIAFPFRSTLAPRVRVDDDAMGERAPPLCIDLQYLM